MQRLLLWIAGAMLLTACGQTGKHEEGKLSTGAKEEIISATVEEILAQPAEYENKQIAISGMVTHVCRHGGQKCFVLGQDGETQIRIVPGGDIDEFTIDLEGSTIAFRGTFKILDTRQASELMEDHESQAEHDQEMAHSEAEKADYFIEAIDFKEVTP
jgi:hypothetical protein